MNKKSIIVISVVLLIIFSWLIYSYNMYIFIREIGFDKNKYELIENKDFIGGNISAYKIRSDVYVNFKDVPSNIVTVKSFTNSAKEIKSYSSNIESMSSCLKIASEIAENKYPKIEFYKHNFYKDLNTYYLISEDFLARISCIENNNKIFLSEIVMPNITLEKINKLKGIDNYLFGEIIIGEDEYYTYKNIYEDDAKKIKIAKNKNNEIYSIIKTMKFINKKDCLTEFSILQSEIKKKNFVKKLDMNLNFLNVKYIDDRYLVSLNCSKDSDGNYNTNYLVTDSLYSDIDYFLLKENIIEYDNLNTNFYK